MKWRRETAGNTHCIKMFLIFQLMLKYSYRFYICTALSGIDMGVFFVFFFRTIFQNGISNLIQSYLKETKKLN